MAKKKKSTVDIRLFLFRNIKKSFKYYFKNILYILFANIVGFIIINNFFKTQYAIFIMKFFSTPISFNIAYYGSFILLFSTIKIILYGNTVCVMKAKGANDIKDLFSLVIKRFLPTLGTFIIYMFAVLFLSLLLVIPGIVFFFYYYFAVFLCAVGDINNKEKNTMKVLNGGKALARSYNLVKNNLIRFMLLTIIMALITYALQVGVITLIVRFGFVMNNLIYNIVRFCIFDLIIIYSALMFTKFESIENDVIEEEFKNNQEEQAMLNQAAINNFKTKK